MARSSEAPPIVTIIAITLFIIAGVLAYAFYGELHKTTKNLEISDGKRQGLEERWNELFDKQAATAEMIFGDANAQLDKDSVNQLVAKSKNSVPDSNATSLKGILAEYQRELDSKINAASNAKQKQDLAESLLEKERKEASIRIQNMKVLKDQTEKEVQRLKQELAGARSESDGQLEKFRKETEKQNTELNKELGDLKLQASQKNEKIERLNSKIRKLEKVAKRSKGPASPTVSTTKKPWTNDRELPDGKIVRIDNSLRVAIVDIGRKQGIKRGMRFNIYRDSGAARRHLKGQLIVKKVHDLISEAFVTYQRGLGQNFHLTGEFIDPPKSDVEELIRKAGGVMVAEFGPTVDYIVIGKNPEITTISKAQDLRVPYLREHQVTGFLLSPDTIRMGDVLVNPAFSTHHRERFYFFGDFATRMGTIKQKVTSYGSIIVKEVDAQTDYLVIGARGLPEERTVIKKANDLGVTIMKEEELLAFLAD